jgi:hypothetical protein
MRRLEVDVFISWSGTHSANVANALNNFLERLNERLKCGLAPWLSSENIDPGKRWQAELHKALAGAKSCIVCLTPEALHSQWLFFEAGALSTAGKCVYPYIVGLEQAELSGPLHQFQVAQSTKEGTRALVQALLPDSYPPDKRAAFEAEFKAQWPELASVLRATKKELTKQKREELTKEKLEPMDVNKNHTRLSMEGFRQLLDIYFAAVAHGLLGVVEPELETITSILTPDVVSEIQKVRVRLENEPDAQLGQLPDGIIKLGISGPVCGLIERLYSKIQNCRSSVSSFYCDPVNSSFPQFLSDNLPDKLLIQKILAALEFLGSFDMRARPPTLKDVYALVEATQASLKAQIGQKGVDALLGTADGQGLQKLIEENHRVPASVKVTANGIPIRTPDLRDSSHGAPSQQEPHHSDRTVQAGEWSPL